MPFSLHPLKKCHSEAQRRTHTLLLPLLLLPLSLLSLLLPSLVILSAAKNPCICFCRCFCCCSLGRAGFSPASKTSRASGLQSAEGRSAVQSPERSRGDYFIAFVFCCCIYFLPFSAQKSHVKPQNHLTPSPPATSAWHVSYTQPAILDIDQKQASPGYPPGLTHLERRLYL